MSFSGELDFVVGRHLGRVIRAEETVIVILVVDEESSDGAVAELHRKLLLIQVSVVPLGCGELVVAHFVW
jgi:hypothetical protein